ncbi:MAG TPA: enoyl-CoA hydratase/isomerase family protein, partial [Dehalococcoidia bacterium]|nr:enoyl-CoA hydratase/isomerase family protein [Dehalococcoidia bacterium]
MDYQDIIYAEEGGIATMTLNRPDEMNALSPSMRESMYQVIENISKDKTVRVLIITGAGRAFCSGADVKSLAANANRPISQERPSRTGSGRVSVHVLMQKCEKPIIAAVNGVAAGAGLDLAMACDIRIASDSARFTEVYIRRGLLPVEGGIHLLPRLVGIDKACELIWTGDMIDAREAERIGLVTMVVPHDELEIATRELAEKLAKAAPLAIQRAKRA